MRVSYLLIVLGATLATSGGAAAQGLCDIQGGRYFPAQNDSVSYGLTIQSGGSCFRNFGSPTMTFTGTSVVTQPANGTVRVISPTRIQFSARAGFRGTDRFVVRVCAQGQSGRGCSTLTHVVTVR